MRQIGTFSKRIIELLNLQIEQGTPIFIGDKNIAHIKERHPEEYDLYFPRIEEIISDPDFVGKDPKNNSIDFVKLYQAGTEYIQVSVRIDMGGRHIARTLFMLASFKAERYIDQGTLVRV